MRYSERALSFLRAHGMAPDGISLSEGLPPFKREMLRGLSGEGGSLKMIPTYLRCGAPPKPGARAAVIDAGGTNFRAAAARVGARGVELEDIFAAPMPGTQGDCSWDEFIDFTARALLPRLYGADCVGFCFSYPTEETEALDGRMICRTKQLRLFGFEGRLICADLGSRLRELGAGQRRIVLLNDTPAVLLSGSASAGEYDGLIGLIAGTGLNTCCEVEGGSHGKLRGFAGKMLVNLESGGYDGHPRGDFDRLLDLGTSDTGDYLQEKMCSGAYLGPLCRLTLRAAAEEGLFSEDTTRALLAVEELTSPQADALAEGAELAGAAGEDAALVSELCRALIERSARCVAVNLAAILSLCGQGRRAAARVCVDGSLYKKSRLFRSFLHEALSEYEREGGASCEFFTCENATMVGTALAALANR